MLICSAVSKYCAIVKRFHRDHKILNVNYVEDFFIFCFLAFRIEFCWFFVDEVLVEEIVGCRGISWESYNVIP